MTSRYPELDRKSMRSTIDALHAYSRILGSWTSSCRAKRKHWWHASLRPSLTGITTGAIFTDVDFELEINLRDSLLQARLSNGLKLDQTLQGQSVTQISAGINEFLTDAGLAPNSIPDSEHMSGSDTFKYSARQAKQISIAWSLVKSALEDFRAGIREETSPIQLWPHHFDMAMLWLPGSKIPGQDPDNEEYADQQMNFGFTLGDDNIPEPYFYITAYPQADAFTMTSLPAGTTWHTKGFNGAVLLYRALQAQAEPQQFLLKLWNDLLKVGKQHMLD